MQLHPQTLFAGIARQGLPQQVIAGVLGVDAGVDFDPAMIEAVPLVHNALELSALLIGLKVEVLVIVDKAVAGKGQIGLDAGLRNGLGSGVGVVVEVRHAGHAEAKALGNGQQRRCLGPPGIHFGFLFQQLLQGLPVAEVIGVAPQDGGCQVSMTVYETRHSHHARAVDDGLGQLLGDLFGDEFNFSVSDANVDAEEHLRSGCHGHGGYVGD